VAYNRLQCPLVTSRTLPLSCTGSHTHFEQRTLRWYNTNDGCMACCRTTRSTIADTGIARGGPGGHLPETGASGKPWGCERTLCALSPPPAREHNRA
jgi:hypothetical protein